MRNWIQAALVVMLLSVSLESDAGTHRLALAGQSFDRRAERPRLHAFLGTQPPGTVTTSYMERTLTWPAGSSQLRLEFDYFVDSEVGWDKLRVLIDGVEQWTMSGRSRYGHARVPISSSGNHIVRFEYRKDHSVDLGLDTAWVDNVAAVAASGRVSRDGFSERGLDAPNNWTVGGHSGGWTVAAAKEERAVTRPPSHALLGYQAQPTTSYMLRSVFWSGAGSFRFSYLVDSEPNYDYLRVLVDGNVVFAQSGKKQGSKSIAVTAGDHVIKFEYLKDTSVDAGLDIARIHDVSFRVGENEFEYESFDGKRVGIPAQWWTSGGYGGGWLVTRHMGPRLYVQPNELGALPTIDGTINPESASTKEFSGQIEVLAPDYGLAAHRHATFTVRASQSTESLYLATRVPSSTATLGDEAGYVEYYFDADHYSTVRSVGPCSPNWRLPHANDRMIRLDYTISTGQAQGNVSTLQKLGACSVSWPTTSGSESWPILASVRESQDLENHVDIELKVTLRSNAGVSAGAFESGWLGLALRHEASNANWSIPRSFVRLPYTDGLLVDQFDVSSWQTLCFLDPAMTETGAFDNKIHDAFFPFGP